MHDVPLLTNSKPIKTKSSFLVSDFLNYKFQGDNTQKTEKIYWAVQRDYKQYHCIITPEFKMKLIKLLINNHLETFINISNIEW